MKLLLRPLSLLYRLIVSIRNYFFDRGLFTIDKFSVPIVSVGNLTMGGTGKTPILCDLIQNAINHGLRVGIVSRGYGGHYQGVKKVPVRGSDVAEYGDEPIMMAQNFPTVPVYVGRKRAEAVSEMLKNENVQIIFADDAFQHRRLARDLDVVVVDCTEPIENYQLIPEGRAREPLSSLARAQFVILNKVNMVEPLKKQQMIEMIEDIIGESEIIECEYHLQGLRHLSTSQLTQFHEGEKVVLLSAIGRPQSFQNLVSKIFAVQKHFQFRDHYIFREEDLKKVVMEMNARKAHKIIVTQKDAVKLSHFTFCIDRIWVTDLRPKLGLSAKKLNERILNLVKT